MAQREPNQVRSLSSRKNKSKNRTITKNESFLIKVNSEDHDLIRRASIVVNKTKTEFVLGYALEKASEVLNEAPNLHHIEDRDGVLYFKNRNLEVFKAHYFLAKAIDKGISELNWADDYCLSPNALKEAKSEVARHQETYDQWVAAYESESSDE